MEAAGVEPSKPPVGTRACPLFRGCASRSVPLDPADSRGLGARQAWRPRTVIVPDEPDVSPEAFQKDTPEHVLVQFLHAWLRLRRSDSTAPGRYGLMATHVFPRHVSSAISLRAREMASLLEGLQLDGFRLIRAIDAAPALACVDVECTFVSKLVLVGYRLLFADANGEVLPRGSACGRWYVVNWGEPALMIPVVPSDLG